MVVIHGDYLKAGCFICTDCGLMDNFPIYYKGKKICTDCFTLDKLKTDPEFAIRWEKECKMNRKADHQPRKDIDNWLKAKYG